MVHALTLQRIVVEAQKQAFTALYVSRPGRGGGAGGRYGLPGGLDSHLFLTGGVPGGGSGQSGRRKHQGR